MYLQKTFVFSDFLINQPRNSLYIFITFRNGNISKTYFNIIYEARFFTNDLWYRDEYKETFYFLVHCL